MKILYLECTKCKNSKPVNLFHKDLSKRTGLHPHCKACHSERRKKLRKDENYRIADRLRSKMWRKNNKEKVRELSRWYIIKWKYGITREDFMAIKSAQDNKCAICRKEPTLLHVDHCHKTKKIRGLLCRNCNTSIGKFQDSPLILQNAIDYLVRHKAG